MATTITYNTTTTTTTTNTTMATTITYNHNNIYYYNAKTNISATTANISTFTITIRRRYSKISSITSQLSRYYQ